MMKPTLEELSETLELNKADGKHDRAVYGEVKQINSDQTYQVSLNGSDTTVKCARLSGAKVGDTVMVELLANGYAVVTGTVGGDTDASDAQASANAAVSAAGQAQSAASAASTAAATAVGKADQASAAASAASTAAATADNKAEQAASAAATADSKAEAASSAASRAESSASAASSAASRAEDKADDAADAAEIASQSATGALDSLATVQDVLGVLNWAQDNATFTRTTDTELEPGKIYWTYNSSTQKYEPVADPSPAALSTYYEISGVDEAMADFVNSHLALTTEGLWVLPNGISGGGFKVLIATGGTGHTYPNAGTYIIGASGPVAYFGSSGIELKGLSFSNVLETYCRIRKDDTFLKAVKYVGTGELLDYTQTTQITEDGFIIKRERGSGTAVTAFEVTPSDPDGTSENDDALLLLQATRDGLQRYPEGGSVRLSTSDGEGVVLGYWLNGNFTETARMDNFGGITVADNIWSDGNIEAEGNINCNGNMSPAGDLVAGGSVEDGNGNVLADKADASSIPTKTSDLTNDGDGTSPFATLNDIPTGGGGSTFYGTNNQSASTTARTVDVADTSFSLERGVIVGVYFSQDVPASATMNVNYTGAKNMKYRAGDIPAGIIKSGDTASFQYDGNYWRILSIGRIPTNTSELTNDSGFISGTGLFKIVNLDVTNSAQIAAHGYQAATTYTVPAASRPSGMTLVGIVGYQTTNYRLQSTTHYVNGSDSILANMANTSATAVSAGAKITFKLLYIKATSA